MKRTKKRPAARPNATLKFWLAGIVAIGMAHQSAALELTRAGQFYNSCRPLALDYERAIRRNTTDSALCVGYVMAAQQSFMFLNRYVPNAEEVMSCWGDLALSPVSLTEAAIAHLDATPSDRQHPTIAILWSAWTTKFNCSK